MSAETASAGGWISTGESARKALIAGTALKAAAVYYTVDEFREFERDVEAGKVDIRMYDDGLVIMRVAKSLALRRGGYGYGQE